jgi:hypothetical protein
MRESCAVNTKRKAIGRGGIHNLERRSEVPSGDGILDFEDGLVVASNIIGFQFRVCTASEDVTRGIRREGAQRALAISDGTGFSFVWDVDYFGHRCSP